MDLSQHEWAEKALADTNGVILDVRTEEEWEDGIIPNAVHNDIYKGQGFVYRLDEFDKTKNFYVYCKAGGRSAQACAIMKELGFANVFNLEGGIMNWDGEIVEPEM